MIIFSIILSKSLVMTLPNLTFNLLNFGYSEMIVQMAVHFSDEDIPPLGKDNLWFL